jgi:hypothetical protein
VRSDESALGTIELKPDAMKQPSTIQSVSAPPPQMDPIDTATLKLLAAWKAEDATTDPERLREADEEIAEFKKAMNENRSATGARLLFP